MKNTDFAKVDYISNSRVFKCDGAKIGRFFRFEFNYGFGQNADDARYRFSADHHVAVKCRARRNSIFARTRFSPSDRDRIETPTEC